jgi:ribosomal-protein-alanine N-acetyltransferase
MPLRLRSFDPADFDSLYDIDQACYPRGIAYSRRTLREFLSASDADCLVAEDNAPGRGEITGFLIAEAEGGIGHIVTLDVVESHRRQGVGSALLVAEETRLAARGVSQVFLETATSNSAGVAFWQRHGYRSFGVIRGYYLGRLDAYQMRKTIAA